MNTVMEIFDTHLHLSEELDNDELVRRAWDAGVRYLLVCGGSWEDSLRARKFAEHLPNVFFAAGVHPHEADGFDGNTDVFRPFAESRRFCAVGEIGIDTYYGFSGLEQQEKTLREMLNLAREFAVPAIIHCRAAEGSLDAYGICYRYLSEFAAQGGTFVIHCFAGNVEWMKKFAELGAFFGVGGMLTFKRSDNIREVVMQMPSDRILLETDAPYLAPVPFRGKPNVPEYLPLVAYKLAEMKGVPAAEIAELTTGNAFRLFKRARR